MKKLQTKPWWAWRKWFGQLLTEYEKILLAALSVVIVVSGSVWVKQYSINQTNLPAAGGTYIEGIVGKQVDAETIAAKITKCGLFTLDEQGNLQNQLISDWQANGDKTEYRFSLFPDINPSEIAQVLTDNNTAISNGVVTVNGHDVTISLPTANPDLPLVLAQPFFDYGPYKLGQVTDQTITLSRNPRTHAVTPYLNRIILQVFSTEDQLKRALARRQVNGAVLKDTSFDPNGYGVQNYHLPRYYAVIFNINKTPFRDQNFRTQVMQNTNLGGQTFTLTSSNSAPYQDLAKSLVDGWKAAGANVTLDLKSDNDIQNQIAPTRNFQAMLIGLNYGDELDPYYLWDSSQIRPPGNNLSGIKDDKVDSFVSQIRQTLNVADRLKLIDSLHQRLGELSVMKIVSQDQVRFLTANTYRVVLPTLPLSVNDRFQQLARWSVK